MQKFVVAVLLIVATLSLPIVHIVIPLLEGEQLRNEEVIPLLVLVVAALAYLAPLLVSTWSRLRKREPQPVIALSPFEGLSGMDNSPQAQALRDKTNALWDDSEHPDDR